MEKVRGDASLYWAFVNDQIIERDLEFEASIGFPDVGQGGTKRNSGSGGLGPIHDGGKDKEV